MKVYIVTDGCYSDYSIKKVFSNKPAAEEYKKWHNIKNEVEEYELFDSSFADETGERSVLIRVQGTVYLGAVEDITYEIRPNIIYEQYIRRGVGIQPIINKPKVFKLFLYHYIPADKWDEEKYKNKLTKALYDYAAMARSMFAEGATVDMINSALRNSDMEEN